MDTIDENNRKRIIINDNKLWSAKKRKTFTIDFNILLTTLKYK